jgi:hypothetical protein
MSSQTDQGEKAPAFCLHVIGMHRSGTSAIARALVRLGVPTTREDDLMAPSEFNPTGYYESHSMSVISDRVLDALGGTWDVPPRLEPGWERSARLDALRLEARAVAESVLPRSGAQWKNPRACLLLPFWRRAISRPDAAVFVWRHPAAVALSMLRADGVDLARALALWDHYNRSAWESMTGMPVLAVCYDDIFSDGPSAEATRESWHGLRRLMSHLGMPGLALDEGTGLGGLVEVALRHESPIGSPSSLRPVERSLLSELSVLSDALGSRRGWHDSWLPGDLPPCGETAMEVLEEARSALRRAQAASAPAPFPAPRVARVSVHAESGTGTVVGGDADVGCSVVSSRGAVGLVSILTVADGPPLLSLEATFESLRSQSYESWEWCVCCGPLAPPRFGTKLAALAARSRQVKVSSVRERKGGTSLLEQCLAMADGALLFLVGAGDLLAPHCLEAALEAFLGDPLLAVAYADADVVLPRGEIVRTDMKPGWSPVHLLGDSYAGRMVFVRRHVLEEHSLAEGLQDGSEAFELILRAYERGLRIQKLAQPVGAWRAPHGARTARTADDPWCYRQRRMALESHFLRSRAAWSIGAGPRVGTFRVRPRLPSHRSASVLIGPVATAASALRAVDSLAIEPGMDDFEVLVIRGTDAARTAEDAAAWAALVSRPRHRLVDLPIAAGAEPFRYLVGLLDYGLADRLAYLGFGVLPVSQGWLGKLMAWLELPEVGVVNGVVERGGYGAPALRAGSWIFPPPWDVAGETGAVNRLAFALRTDTLRSLAERLEMSHSSIASGETSDLLKSEGMSCITDPLAVFSTL